MSSSPSRHCKQTPFHKQPKDREADHAGRTFAGSQEQLQAASAAGALDRAVCGVAEC